MHGDLKPELTRNVFLQYRGLRELILYEHVIFQCNWTMHDRVIDDLAQFPAHFQGASFPGEISGIHGPNCAKLGDDIGQSSTCK